MKLFFFLLLITSALSCAPPIPASFQRDPPPSIIPASPAYSQQQQSNYVPPPPSHDQLVSGVAYGNSPTYIQSAPKAPSDDSNHIKQTITPYPGYIPPPPALHSQTQREVPQYPKLIDTVDSVKEQQSLNELESIIEQEANERAHTNCPETMSSLNDFLSCVVEKPLPPIDEYNSICNFDGNQGCRFSTQTSSVNIGHFQTDEAYTSFTILSRRTENFRPRGSFLYFVEHKGTNAEEEMVLSTVVNCQKGNGILKFEYWIIGDEKSVEVRVCTQEKLARSCTQVIQYGSNSSVSVEVVHPNSTVFDVEIVASNLVQPTAVAIDNIEYSADLCESREKMSDNSAETQEAAKAFFDESSQNQGGSAEIEPEGEVPEPTAVPRRPGDKRDLESESQPTNQDYEDYDKPDASSDVRMAQPHLPNVTQKNASVTPCSLLNCDFSYGLCGYKNYVSTNKSMITADWQLGNQRVGNRHTGIREQENDGGFLYVGTDSSRNKVIHYILESAPFSLNEDIRLALDVYRRSNDITLQICLDTITYCPYSVSPFEKDVYWKEGETFVIPKDTTTIYLKAIQWRRFKWLAIDNIRVLDKGLC
ncbi:hypothetical protein WR25_12411 [Diploscapter pachys]|uniref:MAM domain-containing protein n=1 Tax=Diploscapter pachys TaxID=2018661 RepID=A0A2A2JN87_9BILA|nr:hypothetical protein WR25_12411 [Diploscapter pachys]